jgi:hypothetical protein
MGAITRGIANNILGNGAVDGTDALSGTIPATNIGNPSLANLTTFPPSVDAGIPQVAGDPPAPSEGDVWYNTNTYKLRVRGVSAALGSWSSGGNLNTARLLLAGAGTQTAALGFGGSTGPAPTGVTESYNGSTWTEVNDLNSARRSLGGDGTQTSAIGFGGASPPFGSPGLTGSTETWNGTSWTEVNDLNTVRRDIAGIAANNTAALAATGSSDPGFYTNTESWNGTSWTEVNDVNTGRSDPGRGGVQTAGIIFGGSSGSITAVTETWNGTSWTEVNDMNTARRAPGGNGTQTSAIGYGGTSPYFTVTESWNGTSWTEVADLSVARAYIGGAGVDNTSGLAIGGDAVPGASTATEEWNGGVGNLNVDLA